MREYAKTHAHHRSLSLALQSPRSPETLRLRYPLAYWDTVRRQAADNGLDPYLVLSLMRQESRFKPGAVSPRQRARAHAAPSRNRARRGVENRPAGARGAAALRSGTEHQARRASLEGAARRLRPQSGQGAGRLQRRQGGGGTLDPRPGSDDDVDDLEFIERISYRETRQYVKAVLRNYHAYRTLYGEAPARRARRSGGLPPRAPNQALEPFRLEGASVDKSLPFSILTG